MTVKDLPNGKRVNLSVPPTITVDNDFTGIITVTTAGQAVSGGNVPNGGAGFILKAHPANTGAVWIFPDGRTKANGYPLNFDDQTIVNVENLNLLDFDAEVSGNKICWIKQ